MNYLSSLKRLSQQRKEVKDGRFDVYNVCFMFSSEIGIIELIEYKEQKNMANKIELQIKDIIATVLEVSVDEINEETAIGDLPSWDSIHHLQIIAAIEQDFNIRFTPDVVLDLEDIGDIISAVEARVQQ